MTIEELERLEKAATAGPWDVERMPKQVNTIHTESQYGGLISKRCVVCVCEDDERCHGCGAKHCGTHPVGQIPDAKEDE